jgi:hypothetical protein
MRPVVVLARAEMGLGAEKTRVAEDIARVGRDAACVWSHEIVLLCAVSCEDSFVGQRHEIFPSRAPRCTCSKRRPS